MRSCLTVFQSVPASSRIAAEAKGKIIIAIDLCTISCE